MPDQHVNRVTKNMSWSFLISPFIRWIMPMECHFTAWMMPIMGSHGAIWRVSAELGWMEANDKELHHIRQEQHCKIVHPGAVRLPRPTRPAPALIPASCHSA